MAVPSFTSRTRRYAVGGPMPQGAPAPMGDPMGDPPMGDPGMAPPADPAAQGGGDPAQLQAAVAQYAQTKDPQLAVQIADMLVGLMGQGGGGSDPAMGGGAPMGGMPQMNKKGGMMPSFGKKGAGGGKPAFGAPGAGAAKGDKPNPFAKGGAAAPKGGKPLTADQKVKARRDAAQAAGFGKKK